MSGYAALTRPTSEVDEPEFEDRWTGGYIFENEWQSFRTRRSRDLELTTALHSYDRPGRYTVAVKGVRSSRNGRHPAAQRYDRRAGCFPAAARD